MKNQTPFAKTLAQKTTLSSLCVPKIKAMHKRPAILSPYSFPNETRKPHKNARNNHLFSFPKKNCESGKFSKADQGFASIIVLFVLFVLLWAGVTVSSLGSTNLLRAPRELRAAQAFQTATAASDYVIQQLLQRVNSHGHLEGNFVVTLEDIPGNFPHGAMGYVQVNVLPGGDGAWVTSNVYVGDIGRSVRVLVNIKDVGIWANAIFAGAGASGRAINGNVDIRGSVHLLGDGEAYSDLNGNGQRDPAEPFQDLNGNGQWDPGEPFTDLNGD
ncbi:MAG: hypothetical protein QXI19_06315, partial [Candidatus Caldarchaeum sp.]